MQTLFPELGQTPLNEDQHQFFQQFIASLSPEQLAWAGGYLTGLVSKDSPASGATASVSGGISEITILVGSQTGNSEALAEQTHQLAASRGLRSVIKKMGDYKLPQLKTEKNLLVIVSTHGEGEPPDNARAMHEYLFSKRAPSLKQAHFAVLGLGDSSYEFFCKMGIDFDRRLEELGATRIYQRVDCDVDYEHAAEAWMEGALGELAARTEVKPQLTAVPLPSFSAAKHSLYTRKNPFPAVLLEDIVLNGSGSIKETHHLELSLEGSGLTYEPGDAVGIYPANAPDVIAELLQTLHFSGDTQVKVDGSDITLYDALYRHYEATLITRPMMQKYSALAKNPKLDQLLGDNSKKELNDYLYGREIIDLAVDFPADNLSPQAFVECLRKLPPRLYSIASSLKQHPNEVHLTVAAVRYQSYGRERKGVCSTFLADRIAEDGAIPVYIDHNNNFKLPADASAPIIMIGPGTGIAPFRAFVEEREAIGATGKSWLFFGDQHFMTDFLYQAEWLQYLKNGVLTRMDVAFSRDQEHKVYVQHLMLEHGRDLYAWLQEGAHIYVCGDEKRMAHDVHAALLKIVASEGGLGREEEYIATLQKEKRYQRDVY
ncbi:sulfite reductase, alpha subunit, flavoprotein [Candidatus Methylobacter favarea]|uniref:Sulfite reductase [NADPH] flavoprotein alpha-component n=1 Tax=Candidatus Methylobacter favarea TaxID=2707345 RepID=A0A8S0X9H5_9GAMM|nr:assimilatory sulfite reductase (NADPH) flavoprotein subunit [Candidatus Methylobacter favarea]CAA9892286.1 sulfite reductase, alpha subunit, flavoprotein [Candidatus Methylobacter favarea]